VFLDFGSTGDGLVAALKILAVMGKKKKALSELRTVMTIVPQVLKNIRISKKPDLETLPTIAKAMSEVKAKLGDRGRLLVRYSGTEPLCRVMIEGENAQDIESMANHLVQLIAKEIA
jgi:phosphoglucosamine mutase